MLIFIKKYWIWIVVILATLFIIYYFGNMGYALIQERIKRGEAAVEANTKLTEQITNNQKAYEERYLLQDVNYQQKLNRIVIAKAVSDKKILELQKKIKEVEDERDAIIIKVYSKIDLDNRFHFILIGKPKS